MRSNKRKILALTYIAITASLICLSALIHIPFPIPITLQTLVLFLSLFTLGGRLTSASVALYLTIGALGLPVFSGFSGGVGRLFDATGGFLFGMLFASLLWWIFEKFSLATNTVIRSLICIGTIYLFGGVWYCFGYLCGENFLSAITVSVLPFIIPDGLKIYLAYLLSKRLAPIIKGK